MNEDIVDRLREYAGDPNCEDWCHHLLHEAASEIVRLRQAEESAHYAYLEGCE